MGYLGNYTKRMELLDLDLATKMTRAPLDKPYKLKVTLKFHQKSEVLLRYTPVATRKNMCGVKSLNSGLEPGLYQISCAEQKGANPNRNVIYELIFTYADSDFCKS